MQDRTYVVLARLPKGGAKGGALRWPAAMDHWLYVFSMHVDWGAKRWCLAKAVITCARCAPVRLCTCAPVRLCTCAPVHLCTCAPVHLCTCAPVHLCACARCAPVQLCTCAPQTASYPHVMESHPYDKAGPTWTPERPLGHQAPTCVVCAPCLAYQTWLPCQHHVADPYMQSPHLPHVLSSTSVANTQCSRRAHPGPTGGSRPVPRPLGSGLPPRHICTS